MAQHILGISALYHDSAAALIADGRIVAAAQEERFTRVKHDRRFPENAVAYCLREAGIGPKDLAAVVYYDKPLLTMDRVLETALAFAPRGFGNFRAAMAAMLGEKLRVPAAVEAALGPDFRGELLFCLHHLSHAASAYFPSPFESAAVLTVDGVGEWTTTALGTGRGNAVSLKSEIRFPHSLGLLYSAFTHYLGFKVNSGEYKVMGLAPFGVPRYRDRILGKLMDLREDGSFHLDMRYFDYCAGWTMTSEAFHELFEGPPRRPESPLDQRHKDLAASIQQTAEEVMLRLARHARRETGKENLCLAGGVALNCVANGLILRERVFKEIFIQPAAGDAGGALGAALYAHHHYFGAPRTPRRPDSLSGSRLGPRFGREEIRRALESAGAVFREMETAPLLEELARLLEEGKVVGLFEGRMEFGPRALGGRSILADPRRAEMRSALNLKIKFREGFRPFAPAVLEEEAEKHFDLGVPSPYMLVTAPVREGAGPPLPAVTHEDNSARVQTVSRKDDPFFHALLSAFQARTGCPALINTSLNVRGEPIAGSPEDALRVFLNTEMDALALPPFLLLKSGQTAPADRQAYLRGFSPD